jgi:glycosyltransferase involved in cell wall biosynthesis
MSNMPGPTICVSIVTYNSARYIGKCLESVLDQRGAPMEILVVDNASSDETLRILESYAGRIRLLTISSRSLAFRLLIFCGKRLSWFPTLHFSSGW